MLTDGVGVGVLTDGVLTDGVSVGVSVLSEGVGVGVLTDGVGVGGSQYSCLCTVVGADLSTA